MAETYHLVTHEVNSVPVTGRHLAHASFGLHERDFLAAELYAGARYLIKPTQDQVAYLAGTTVSAVRRALKRSEYREAILAGVLPLVPPASVSPQALIKLNGGLTDDKLVELAGMVGPDRWLAAGSAAGL